MESKIGKAAIIGGIAWGISLLMGVIVGRFLIPIIPMPPSRLLYLALSMIQSIVAMLAAVIVYQKLITKNSISTEIVILVSLLTGVIESVATFFIPFTGPLVIVGYLLPLVFYVAGGFLVARE